jgi:hypothetical protein
VSIQKSDIDAASEIGNNKPENTMTKACYIPIYTLIKKNKKKRNKKN